ncbi:DUF3224 domain-containing protein [Aestuariivirga litoralis]|uniref:DUF3224 domain-containing protein n=1 Tax=Aestuariivirga litoralis TaxID=2650924 RepID=UPI0018C56FB3|nr:DUF3224 domain-containing protein [Aestuariivirga litoralis]MBG1233666.1 DUF3224 domain-containing protein [Aestuariivirga litoralis]
MRYSGTFKVQNFKPRDLKPMPEVTTALPVGVTTFDKTYEGEIEGRSSTIFVAAYDPAKGGTYIAMESFEGALSGKKGAFNFWHAATTSGKDRSGENFNIVPGSGTGALAGINGSGSIVIDADGTHRVFFEAEGV